MDQGQIGIRLADGSFYPILEPGDRKKKKLILTTVRDNQESVRIDLYKHCDTDNPEYLGSVVIEHLSELPKGEPEIELVMNVDSEEELSASARDIKNGGHQSLHLFLTDTVSDEEFDMPEFEIESSFRDNYHSDTFHEQSADEHQQLYSAAQESAHFIEEGESNPVAAFIPIVVIGVAVIGLLIVAFNFIFPGAIAPASPVAEGTEVPVVVESTKTSTPTAEKTLTAAHVENTPVIDRAFGTPVVERSETPVPFMSPIPDLLLTPLPEMTLTIGGVPYLVRPGDTLWGLSYSFYKDPRMYWKIFAENNITNPDLLFPGQEVVVPRR